MKGNNFKQKKKQAAFEPSRVPTILSGSTRITGDITVTGDLKVGGHVEGDIIVSGKIIVAEGGRIFGNVDAMDAHVFGKVNGDISVAGLLRIEFSAQVVGDMKYSSVEIAKGGTVKGSFQPLKSEERDALKERHDNAIGSKMNGLSVVRGEKNTETVKTLGVDTGETASW